MLFEEPYLVFEEEEEDTLTFNNYVKNIKLDKEFTNGFPQIYFKIKFVDGL